MTELRGAHAVITGGSSGIGLATAAALIGRGASVSLIARNPERLETAASALRDLGGQVRTVSADVSDQKSVEVALTELGPCDVLVTSAGQARPGHFLELEDDVFRQMVEVDYFGTLYAVRAVVPSMIERGRGSIVAISSAAGLLGIFGYTAYSPAKFAVRGLMEALRDELKPRGVHVACVYPPDVDTPQLAEENEFKPAETAAISGTIKPLSAHAVAASILTAIEKEQFAVYPDMSVSALARFGPLAAPLLRKLADRRVRQAR